ncbi:VCBS domain-containing protein, partial [Mesorhizobium sp. B2-6-5]|uniref:VCBS domain-containing protein n=1 Tax=Mesorhizobium sp. B2-6-5 TaxID=2589912 RepID=UPI00117228DF
SGLLTIADVDQGQSNFTAQPSFAGTYGTFTLDAAGHWTYSADDTQTAIQQLGASDSITDSFTAVSSDGTASQLVTVTIHGTNDNPTMTATATGSVTEDSPAGATETTSGTISFADVDLTDTHTVSASFLSSTNAGGGQLGSLSAAKTLDTSGGTGGTGTWNYSVNNAAVQFLAAGQTIQETYKVTVADNHGGSTTQNVVVTIHGTNDAPVIDLNGAAAGASASLSYTAGSAATAIAPAGTVTDIDSANFGGGSLTVAFTTNGTAADQLTIQNQGTGVGQIGVTGTNVTYGGTTIGTFTGGTGGTSLVVTFNANATQAATQALADHILYANATSATIAKTVTYTLVDGDGTANGGADTSSATATINVTGGDTTPPNITLISGVQGNNNAPSTLVVTFSEVGMNHSFFDSTKLALSNSVLLVSPTGTWGTTTDGGGNTVDTYTLLVTKPNNGTTYTATFAAGAFKDGAGNLSTGASQGTLKPAGTSGEPINLALTDPSHEGALITVTVKDVPSGWTIDGATHNADGSWTTQTNDLHGLTVTTPVNFTGAAVLDVQMTWINADGTLGTASIADNVEAYAPGSPIFAWSGDDVLTGSHGNDLFVFSQPIGADTVHNFDTAADQIDLIGYNGLADFADLQTHIADDANGNAVIALGDGQSITLDGEHSGALTASNFVFDQTPVVNNSGTMTIGDGALLPLSGIINNSGLISLDSTGSDTLLQVIQHGVTLQGSGQILLSDSAANMISGTGPDVTLVNVDNTISGAGQLGGGMLSLDNQGTIIATGSHALVIDTGGSVVANSGTLEAAGSGGLTVAGGLANSGMLWANGGDIVIHGQVTGDGDATIGNLSKLEFGGASSTDVTFGHDAAGTLQLDDSFDYSGRIGGITNDDRLDLGDILFGVGTTAVYQANQDGSGGTLTVSDGTHGAALHLVGNYDANAFKLADDGQGHTVVSYNPAEFTLTGIGNGAISSDFVV